MEANQTPETAIATRDEEIRAMEQLGYDRAQLRTITNTVAKGATVSELSFFLTVAKHLGLSPFMKQIYFVKRQGQVAHQVGIDGYRAVADGTEKYAGNSDPTYTYATDLKHLQEVCGCLVCTKGKLHPLSATVTVKKIIATKPDGEPILGDFTATARWDQYLPDPKNQFMWVKMPELMLGKCAEALSLRKAFPAQLSGTYTHEEMMQAGEGGPKLDPLKEVDGTIEVGSEAATGDEPVEVEAETVTEDAVTPSEETTAPESAGVAPEAQETTSNEASADSGSAQHPEKAAPAKQAPKKAAQPEQSDKDKALSEAISIPNEHGKLVALAVALSDYGNDILEKDLVKKYFTEKCTSLVELAQLPEAELPWLRRRVIAIVQVEDVAMFNLWVDEKAKDQA